MQAFYRQLNDKFNSGNINNLFGLDQFPADDTEALVLAAKMSLLQVNLYQQLIMLGSAQGENSTLKAFAATAAAKIGVSKQAVFWDARMHARVVLAFTWAHPMRRRLQGECNKGVSWEHACLEQRLPHA